MVTRREFFLEVGRLKAEAGALQNVVDASPPGPLEVLRLSAMLVEGRASLCVNMIDLMMAEKGGGTESESTPKE